MNNWIFLYISPRSNYDRVHITWNDMSLDDSFKNVFYLDKYETKLAEISGKFSSWFGKSSIIYIEYEKNLLHIQIHRKSFFFFFFCLAFNNRHRK